MDRNIHLDFNASTSKYVWKTAFKMAEKRVLLVVGDGTR